METGKIKGGQDADPLFQRLPPFVKPKGVPGGQGQMKEMEKKKQLLFLPSFFPDHVNEAQQGKGQDQFFMHRTVLIVGVNVVFPD